MKTQIIDGRKQLNSLKNPCTSSEHEPPMFKVFRPGENKHTCPRCGYVTVFLCGRNCILVLVQLNMSELEETKETLNWRLVRHNYCLQLHAVIDVEGEERICYDNLPIQGMNKEEIKTILTKILQEIDDTPIVDIKDIALSQYQNMKEDILSPIFFLNLDAYLTFRDYGRERGNAIDGFLSLIKDAGLNRDSEVSVLTAIIDGMRKESYNRRDTLTVKMLEGDSEQLANKILDDIKAREEISQLRKLARPNHDDFPSEFSRFLMGEEIK